MTAEQSPRRFVLSSLPEAPARVLEVGCGEGHLAKSLAEAGYEVVAIDPHAPEGAIFRPVSLEDFEGESFDAVVADRSLHHVHDIEAGVHKLRRMLTDTGVLVLNEFAWDAMNEPTAAWYLAAAQERGVDPGAGVDTARDLLSGWADEHDGLHTAGALRAALSLHFETVVDTPAPYMARYHLDDPGAESLERGAIGDGSISALGFRYVGRPRVVNGQVQRSRPGG